jgi:hypothetical protein
MSQLPAGIQGLLGINENEIHQHASRPEALQLLEVPRVCIALPWPFANGRHGVFIESNQA